MSAKLLLTNFDGTMFRLEVLPDCRDTWYCCIRGIGIGGISWFLGNWSFSVWLR